jgi:multidrug efflux system membrane fusion protein
LEKARNDLATNAALREKGLASPNSGEAFQTALSGAEAAYEAASVGLRNRQVELENTEIRATVPGIIQRPVARVGDLLNPGQSCATIIQLDPMTFNSAVPQAHIGLARIGLEAEIRTIDNHVATGKVSYVAASADAATRTFPVEIEFSNPDGVFLDGQTASAVVSLGSVPATLIPQSITTLAPDGQLGVQGVVDGTVKFYPVTIINDTNEGAWVTGLPLVAEIIIVGQDYVSEGQTVDATLVN